MVFSTPFVLNSAHSQLIVGSDIKENHSPTYQCIGAGAGCPAVSVTIDGITDFTETTTTIGCFSAVLSNSNKTWTLTNTSSK
ncbi:MAG: hypothetical protein IJ785_00930 [Bacteroidales bacterium]|nr:hypothetical protein [Bacteroidales bacterium]